MRRSSSKKKWIFVSFAVVGAVMIGLVARQEFGDVRNLSGTMGSSEAEADKSAVSIEGLEASWLEGTGNKPGYGRLDDIFGMSVRAVNQTDGFLNEHVELYFSRDESFSVAEDCLIDAKDVLVEPSATSAVEFKTTARLVDCLDAGPWYVAVRSSDGKWSSLETVYHVESGNAAVQIGALAAEVAPRGMLNVDLLVHRETTATGVDGLYDFPVDVWLKQGESICIIEAEPIAVQRDPVASWNQSWKEVPVSMALDLRSAKQIKTSSQSWSPFLDTSDLQTSRRCENCTPPEQTGACQLSEGPVQVTAGPSFGGFHVIQETYLHASPVVVQTGIIEVSVRSGEVTQVSKTAYNPSKRTVNWSTSSVEGDDWLIGMKDQTLPAKKPSDVRFTVSAVDLEPGIYETTVLVSASDFYKTETRLQVVVTVLPKQSVVQDQSLGQDLPTSFSLGNYPNPFNPTTTIRFELTERGQTSLVVYDVSGREVRVLHDGDLGSGVHEFRFDADGLPSGTYLYRLTTPSATKAEKMVLLK